MSAPSEKSVGILAFTTPGEGFKAATKQRFSDFIVREVDLAGQVVRLTALPERPVAADRTTVAEGSGSAESIEPKLISLLGEAQAKAVLALHETATGNGEGQDGAQSLVLDRDDDKDRRRDVHRLIKELLPHLQTDTVDAADGEGKCVRLMTPLFLKQARKEAQQANQGQHGGGGRGRGGGGGKRKRGVDDRVEWPVEAGGKMYLGFTLYKENKDSTEAISRLSRLVGMGPNAFQFAGTKDKRGVTSQRVNVYKLMPARLVSAMAKAPFGDSIVVGDLRYEEQPMRMGAHGGNRFTIVLRDVSCGEEELESALRALQTHGFINYFGLQRFGNNDAAGTHKLGAAMLRADYDAVLRMILAGRPGERLEERKAREVWEQTQDAAAALKVLPRHMHIERGVLEGIVKHGRSNALGCLSRVPKAMRMMYLHAFQSLVFNRAASERVRLYGCERAVAGDLVWAAGSAPPPFFSGQDAGGAAGGAAASASSAPAAVPDDPAAAAGGVAGGDLDPEALEAVAESGAGSADFVPHVVTAEEAAAGTYSIEEVLLPLPGHKVQLPRHEVAAEYALVLEEHGIRKEDLKHKVAELALPGSYRKLLQRPQQMVWRVLKYDDPNLPLAATDLMTLRGEEEPAGVPGGALTAARLEFTLPSSTYATMCLRELTKQSTERGHQMQLNSAAADVPTPNPAADWACPGCGANVFASRNTCFKCKQPKPEAAAPEAAAALEGSTEAVAAAAATASATASASADAV
jgi:tRNA pseudouridine13 synthase